MLDNEKTVDVGTLIAETEALRKAGARMVTATGLDEGDHFTILYHFDLKGVLHHLRLSVGKAEVVPSVSAVFPGAFLIENEMKELIGIQIAGMSVDYGGHLFLLEGVPLRPLAKDASDAKGSPNGKARPETRPEGNQ